MKLCDREAAGAASSSAAFKSITGWLTKYNGTKLFVLQNRAGLRSLMDREAAGAARSSPAFKDMTSWLKFYGTKWYFAWLF